MSAGTCLVTGGAGFIGTAMSAGLVERFDRVVVLDVLHPQIHPTAERPAMLHPDVELVVGDVTSAQVWDDLLADVSPDVVVHLAAETGTGQSLTESTRHASSNVVGTSQMLDALRRNERLPRRIVLSSSRAVYGEGAWQRNDGTLLYPGPRDQEMLEAARWDYPDAVPVAMDGRTVAPAPASIYGATKLAQEHLVTFWCDALGVEPVILRLQNVYGAGQSLINPYTGIMSLFCRLAREGTSIPLYEDGEVRRDFVYIDDVARALLAAVDAETSGGAAIDIGSGGSRTIRDAAEIIAGHYGAPAPHVTGQFRAGDVRHAWADTAMAAERLGWYPEIDLEQGLTRLATWIDGELGE